MSTKRSVTVDFDELFEDMCYFDQISFIADKLCDQRLEDKLKILRNSLTDVEIMDFIHKNADLAIKVLRGDGFEVE
ncbi:MAG: hypothetical protein IKU01_02335 [Bacteroidales bacterium]|nr:hypothetical protein [Bacteroidales bacterium]